MIAVGVDTHKHEHLARALDGLGQLMGGVTIKADPTGYLELADWLSELGEDAAQQAWRPSNPWHRLYDDVKRRHGKSNPAKAAVARKVHTAAWYILAREQPFKPSHAAA